MTKPRTLRDRIILYLQDRSIARASEFRQIGITGTALSRAVAAGDIIRISRGLYQLPDADIETSQALAEVSKRIPKGTICLTSALAFHGLTDQMPRQVWVAIGSKDRKSRMSYPPIKYVRFQQPYLSNGIKTYKVSGIDVPIYSIAKTLADAFRNPKLVNKSVAIESLRTALEDRKITAGEMAKEARENGAWNQIRSYLEALTSNG